MKVRKIAKSLIVFCLLLILVSCSDRGSTPPPHSHKYKVTKEGFLACDCGRDTIYDPFIAFMSGEEVTEFYCLTDRETNSFSVKGNVVHYYGNRDVVIRTSSSQSLIVESNYGVVTHYGSCYMTTILSIERGKFFEKAKINGYLSIKKGNIVVEKSVSDILISSNDSSPILLELEDGVVIDNVQVNKTTENIITIEGPSSSKIVNLSTLSSFSVGVDVNRMQIKSDNAVIRTFNDARIYRIDIDETSAYDSENRFSLYIQDKSIVDGVFGVSSDMVKLVSDSFLHVHTWGKGTEVIDKDSQKVNLEYRCDKCGEDYIEHTEESPDFGNSGFVVTEEKNRKFVPHLSVIKLEDNTFQITISSSNPDTDYDSMIYKWYVDYIELVLTETGKKSSTLEYTLRDDRCHYITCSYSNKYSGGSTSVQISADQGE